MERFGCDPDTWRQGRVKYDNPFDLAPQATRTRHMPADKADTGRAKNKRDR
jgi:hypothetical protein